MYELLYEQINMNRFFFTFKMLLIGFYIPEHNFLSVMHFTNEFCGII